MRLKYVLAAFLAYSLFMPSVYSQELLTLSDLPVVWQPAEQWQWQGQDLLSQRFSSEQDIATVAQHIQRQLQEVDLRVQRLASAWLLSFDYEPTNTHYLFLLSAQAQGTAGWMSTMKPSGRENQTIALMPSALFAGLYQHSWSVKLKHLDTDSSREPVYVLLQPVSHNKKLWQQLVTRLTKHTWQGGACTPGQWCQWHKYSQKLWLWADVNRGLWHVLWWPK